MSSPQDIAAQLIERLLTDPAFRASFRRDPAGTCRDAGLHDLAQEMSLGAGNAMMTLEQRESKSSLAGVMMAAAMEGVGVFQFAQHVAPALADVDNALGDVLSRVNLPAVSLPGRGALSGGPDAPAAATPAKEPEPDFTAAAPPAVPPPPPPPEPEAAELSASEPPDPAVAAGADAEKPAAAIAEAETPDLPSSTDLPEASDVVEEMGAASGEAEAPPDIAPEGEAPASEVAPVAQAQGNAAPAEPVDRPKPDQALYGLDGSGSPVTPEVKALLDNPNVTFDGDGIADLKAGKIDPRVVAVLTKLAQDHEITVTSMCSDHPRMSASGNVSNHAFGRGLDIGTVDGELVRPGSPAAREVASALAELDPSYRPDEVGTPFPIAAPGYFTDAGHQDHIHLGFKEPISSDWKPPEEVAAGSDGSTAPAAARTEAAPGVPPPRPSDDSGSFLAVTAEAAARTGSTGADSGTFMAVAQPEPTQQPPPAPAPEQPQESPRVDLGDGANPYPGDDAPKEQIAAWMGREAEKRGLPAELPVMAALVEANLQNLDYGDASSLGYFQMLETIWNKGEYAGYADKPELQLKWFLDTAEGVKNQRISRGLPVDDPSQFGVWIADTERPAEQYRGRYQLRLEEARGLLEKGAKAAPPDAASPAPGAVTPAPPPLAPALDAAGTAPSRPPDPDEYGREGSGGPLTAEAKALLENPNVKFDADGIKDLKAGKIDPRAIAVLTKLSQEHEITVTCMCSDHPGGPGSNHWYGRGVDIGTIDGEIVRPGSAAARVLSEEIGELTGSIKPSEIGTPFAIAEPGFFTDANHQDHIHIGWDDPITEDWKPPADVAAPAGTARSASEPTPVAQGAAVPGTPATPAAPTGDSGTFMAVTAESADRATSAAFDSGTFLAVQPPAGPPEAVATDLASVPKAVEDVAATVSSNGGGALGAKALETANTQLNVKEVGGANLGEKVGEFQAVTGAGPGTPWCASFVTWALKQNGHEMEGGGWAAVATWVQNAREGNNGLQIVDAEDARPGDLVAYDWGGQEDFGADGHIGFLASEVKGGKFTAVEGNWQDAVQRVPRQLGGTTNVKFLRIGDGSAPPPTPTAAPGAASAAPTPADPATFAPPPPVPEPGTLGAATPAPAIATPRAAGVMPAVKAGDSGAFLKVAAAERSGPTAGDSGAFMAVSSATDAGPVDAPRAATPPAAERSAAVPADAAPSPSVDLTTVDGDYPGNDATKEEMAAWLAKKAEEAGLPPQLPVMAALVESNLRNLNYGDADSVGFFQMRVGIWNRGEYAGFPENPELQAKWFIDQALAVKKQRLARGLPVDDPSQFGEWIADVERPAEQYRGRYQLRLAEANNLLKQASSAR